MTLQRILTCRGVESSAAVCACGEEHYLVNDRGFGRFNGQTFQHLDFAKVQTTIQRSLVGTIYEYVAVAFYGLRQEVWIGYRVSTVAEGLTGIVKYSLQHNSFTVHEYFSQPLISLAAGREKAGVYTPGPTSDTWGDSPDPPLESDRWDAESVRNWNYNRQGEPQDTTEVIVLGYIGQLATYRHFEPPAYVDGTPKKATAERYGLRLIPDRMSVVKALYPEASFQQFKLELGTSWSPGQEQAGSTRWQPPRVFSPGVNRKIPYRIIGDTFAIRLTSSDQWRLHAIGVEAEAEQKR